MDLLNIAQEANGIDGVFIKDKELPPIIPNRVLIADADSFAYDNADLNTSVNKCFENLEIQIETLRLLAGAEKVELHLTMGNKGGRYEIAQHKEYQGNRKNRDPLLQARVKELRLMMSKIESDIVIAIIHKDQEADDGCAQRMYADKDTGNFVLLSVDKDLWMIGGLHMHPKTYDITEYPWGYGETYLDTENYSTKKVIGKGTSFFWHQLLMGDTADNIQGLPTFGKDVTNRHFPTKPMLRALEKASASDWPEDKVVPLDRYDRLAAAQKPKKCGPVAVAEYLADCKTDLEAFKKVKEAYRSHYGEGVNPYTKWDGTEAKATVGHHLLTEARLLWMRRTVGEDVLTFFKEVIGND
jgi:hypothetical protein